MTWYFHCSIDCSTLFCDNSNVFNDLVFITRHLHTHSHPDRLFLHSHHLYIHSHHLFLHSHHLYIRSHHLFLHSLSFFTLTPSPNPLSHLLLVAVSLATYLPWNGAEYIPPRQQKILQSTIQARTHVLSRLLSLESFEYIVCGHVPVKIFVLVLVLKTRNGAMCVGV